MTRIPRSILFVLLLTSSLLLFACAEPAAPAPQPTPAPVAPEATPVPAAPVPAETPTVEATPSPAPPAVQYPTRPIEIIVGAPAGGGQDIYTRIVARHTEQFLGQPLNIVNMAATPAYTRLTAANPDGYTIGAVPPTGVLQPLLIRDITFAPDDYRWIIQHSFDPIVLVVRSDSPLNVPLEEFIEFARANPGEIRLGVGPIHSTQDFTAVAMEREIDIELTRVRFEGGAPAVTALLGGHIDATVNFYPEVAGQLRAGDLTAIAVTNDGRWDLLPDVPSFTEHGYDVVFGNWRAMAGPRDLPDEIVEILHDAFRRAMDETPVMEELREAGYPEVYRGPDELQAYVEDEVENRYGALIRELGIEPQ